MPQVWALLNHACALASFSRLGSRGLGSKQGRELPKGLNPRPSKYLVNLLALNYVPICEKIYNLFFFKFNLPKFTILVSVKFKLTSYELFSNMKACGLMVKSLQHHFKFNGFGFKPSVRNLPTSRFSLNL
jgi:hypothetical protein